MKSHLVENARSSHPHQNLHCMYWNQSFFFLSQPREIQEKKHMENEQIYEGSNDLYPWRLPAISIVETKCLLPLKNTDYVSHYTRFM